MEDQKNTQNRNKRIVLLAVAAVALAVVLIAVVFAGRGGQNVGEQATETPVIETTEAPVEEATEAPADEGAEAETPDEDAVEVSAQANPEDVLVLVNGEAITRGILEQYKESLIAYYSQQGYDMTNADNLLVVSGMALDTAVENTIIDQKAVELGLELTEEELAQAKADNAEEWAEAVEWYVQYYGGLTEESTEEEIAQARLNVLALLEAMGYTEDAMLESAIENQRFEKVYARMVQGAEVTDADVQAAYDERVAADQAEFENDVAYYEFVTQSGYYDYESYYVPEGYRGVVHILLEADEALMNEWQALTARLEEQQDAEELAEEEGEEAADGDAEDAADAEPTAEPVTQEQVDAAYAAIIASVQPTIDEIYAKLEEGTPFMDLVAEYGADPGMETEPYKSEGYSVHMDSIMWDPAFVAGAFSVDEVGAVAQPVVGSYGVHIIQYLRDVPSGGVELTEERRAALTDQALAEKESALYQQTMQAWIDESEVVYSAEAQAMRQYGDENEGTEE